MNVYDDISETFELPLKNQFEMQSCKTDESKSRPNIALKRIGLELDKAETKCFTLKSELNYMMDVCRKAQTEIKGNKETSSISSIMSFKNSDSKSSFKRNDYTSEIMDVNRTTNWKSQRIHNIELKAEENFDAFNLNPKSAQFSSRKSINDDNIIERSKSLMEGSQKGLLNVTITPRTELDKKLPRLITMPTQNTEEDASREYESHYFPSNMSLERMTLQANDNNYLRATPCSARPGVKDVEGVEDPRLNLNTLNVAKARLVKSRSKTGRSEMNSVYRTDNAVPKVRKRKTKLRSSISKSTVTTRYTGFISRKEAKKRRYKGLIVNRQPLINRLSNAYQPIHQPTYNPPKHVKKSNDVVEIFHNTRLKNNFGVSIKQSKDDEAKYEKNLRLPEDKENPKRIQETVLSLKDRHSKNINHQKCQSHDKKNEQDHCLQMLNCQSNALSEAKPERTKEQDLGPSAQDETQQCKRAINRYDDPLFTPNYEMPTLASKLKRSNRSYFSRFNFRNIPFVVGTSVTPSYNLGLNIQQVLSVMKMRQPIASGVTPLLIRKVSRGMRPMSVLLGQMNGHYEGSVPNMSSQMTGMLKFNSRENLGRDKRLSMFNLHVEKMQSGRVPKTFTDAENIDEKENNVSKQLYKEKVDSSNHKTKQSSSAVSKSDTPANPKIQQGTSRISLKGNIGDHKMRIPDSHNSKEIRDVLINLHDQFEEMNTKYERLRSEVDKSNDKSLAKELSALEKELNVKEEEINAVVGLYKEVMTLKQQMKTLHERNSLVCIATESTKGTNKDSFPISVIPEKSQIFGRRKIFNTIREPPISIQLAALLRQIQSFHKQLQLVS